MAKNQPEKPNEIPEVESFSGPIIVGMSLNNGDEICEEAVDIQWEKEPDEAATLSLTSNYAQTVINPPSFNLLAGEDSGVSTFQVSHPCDANENNVEIKATLVQGTDTATDSRKVTVLCPPCDPE